MKVTSQESKLKGFPKTLMPKEIIHIVGDFEFFDFAYCSLTMLDAPLLTTFIKRWHKETSSFHLLFGKMTITLDDVSSLLCWRTLVISPLLASLTIASDLGVSEVVMLKEFDFDRGFHLRMFWLRDMYEELVVTWMYEVVAMVYMLHLVACTLFSNKSSVYINARYMWMFSSLDVTNWAWGCMALTILYTTLGVAAILSLCIVIFMYYLCIICILRVILLWHLHQKLLY